MVLRELVIKVVTKYDPKGMEQADKATAKLGKSAKATGRGLAKFGRELGKAGKDAGAAGNKTKKAGKDVDKAGNAASKSGRKAGRSSRGWKGLGKSLKTVGKAALKAGKQIAAVGAAATVAAVAASISLVSKKTAELDSIAKGAQTSGLGLEAYQKLSHVAGLTGTDIGTLAKGANKLNKGLAAISVGGGKEASRALTQLGLSAGRLEGKGAEEQLKLISEAMGSVTSAEEKTRLAMALFGEQGAALIPLLNSTREEFDEMSASAGRVFTKEEVKKAEDFNDQMAKLSKRLSDVATGVALELAPLFQEIATKIVEWVEANKPLIEETLPKVITLAGDLFKLLGPIVDFLGQLIAKLTEGGEAGERASSGLKAAALALAAARLAFMGPAGLVLAAAAGGMAIGNFFNSLGASDALADFLGDVTGLNNQLSKLDGLHGGRTSRRAAPDLAGGPIKQQKNKLDMEMEVGGRKLAGSMAALTEVASGKGAGKDPAMRRAASQALEARLAEGSEKNRQASLANARATIAKQQAAKDAAREKRRGRGRGKDKDDFFDFTAQAKSAAKSQAEAFAAKELQRLMSTGMEGDEALATAKTAGRARAKELEAQFIKAGRVIEAGQKGILDVLGLRDPGSMLDNRPPPQSLTIYIAPIIKMIETMTINVTGGDSPQQREALQDAAEQAKDAVYARLSDVPKLVEDMFRLQAGRLQNRGTGGGSAAGGT